MKPHKLLSVGALISLLVLMPATADAQRGSGRSHAGRGVRSVGGSGVIVGGPVVRGTVVRPVVVRPRVIVRQPIVAGSVPAGHFGRIGFGTVPVRTGFGTVPVRTGFEVAPVGPGFVRSGGGFVHAGTGFVRTRPVPGHFVNGHNRGRFVRRGVVGGYPIYPYYPYYSYPYVYPQYGYPTAPYYPPQTYDTYPPQTYETPPQTYDTPQAYDTPQTYPEDYGAGGVSAGLSTYFMDLGNQNQSALTFDVWPVTAEVFVDGVYVGIVQDFSAGRAMTVVPGTHRIDLQAAGFRTATFDVSLTAGQVVPYQGDLQPLRPY
ncbi:MAG: PEGA domain-containing protein [Vicinamibacterales bacterium]